MTTAAVHYRADASAAAASSPGWIVCLGGEDWWYHSHGHFDIQVMKRLARRCRVLYVCSIGMRMPSLRRDAQFWTRIGNKLRSVRRVVRQVDANLWVYSPLPLPLYQWGWGRALNRSLLAVQLRAVLTWLRVRDPLFWINTPTTWPVVEHIRHRGLVYQRTDKYAEYNFDNFNAAYVQAMDDLLLSRADLVFHVDGDLHASSIASARSAILLEQGVDEAFFDNRADALPPADIPLGAGPVIGYVGTLESHKFDAELVRATAMRLPECCFVIVGPYHQNADGLRELPNVHFLGPRRHEQIAPYVKAFDVCMLPTARTEWGLHCKPIKLMEYLAAGRPVVATATSAARSFGDAVHVADTPDGWVAAIRTILGRDDHQPREVYDRIAACTWNRQADRIWAELDCRGLIERRPVFARGEGPG